MLRILFEFALVLVPFIIYIGVLMYKKRDWKDRSEWQGKPLVLLTLAGVMLALLVLFLTSTLDHKADKDLEYRPAHMENGVFKPAEWVKKK